MPGCPHSFILPAALCTAPAHSFFNVSGWPVVDKGLSALELSQLHQYNLLVNTVTRLSEEAQKSGLPNTILSRFRKGDYDSSDTDEFFDVRPILTGFAANIMCSGVFVAGIHEQTVFREDVDLVRLFVTVTVDYQEKSVTAKLRVGKETAKSIYRPGVGCTIVTGDELFELVKNEDLGDLTPKEYPDDRYHQWPEGEMVLSQPDIDVNLRKLKRIINSDFMSLSHNPRAVIIVHRGRIIHEQYGNRGGIGPQTLFLGWSMTKTATNMMLGSALYQGHMNVDLDNDPIDVPEWQATPGDVRRRITWKNMLTMSSGIDWFEISRSPECLFQTSDCARNYAGGQQAFAPGLIYSYSTGGSTLLARTILQKARPATGQTPHEYALRNLIDKVGMRRQAFAPGLIYSYSTGGSTLLARTILQKARPATGQTPHEYALRNLIDKVGMRRVEWEAHPPGYKLGGSGMYARARDWARLGLALMRDGLVDEVAPVGARVVVDSGKHFAGDGDATGGGDPGYDGQARILSPLLDKLKNIGSAIGGGALKPGTPVPSSPAPDGSQPIGMTVTKRILPEGWYKYTCTPSESNPFYGKHVKMAMIKTTGEQICYANGFRNQDIVMIPSRELIIDIVMIPSRELIIVRMSMPSFATFLSWSRMSYIERIASCFPRVH
ncbi:hypothetical protein H696_03101 [Fonticula alba]|uniref:Beta-lactamase-related domain-containing protein n=1 Tax=Fonticula alba TaxID=691883 RepID=A0A058Z8Z8_FONAL|nr:hypothetical protein H696_03101 [Fonticula alba]KCV70750.1 hypothetical protein H696_03101 [Fonticula alba]|eukprot:XP_009495266.1 hypothetical protein H696_03101 [Fonticula alba]